MENTIKALLDSLGTECKPVQFNDGQCQKTCNCVEVEMSKKNTECITNYPCLKKLTQPLQKGE